MNIMDKIIIAEDFTDAPGARYYTDGDFSGQEFYEKLLKEKFANVLSLGGILLIDFDDVWGYASSFISGSFGRLSLDFSKETVLKHLKFKSDDSPILIEKVIKEINAPRTKPKK